jgi:hypothetical protein
MTKRARPACNAVRQLLCVHMVEQREIPAAHEHCAALPSGNIADIELLLRSRPDNRMLPYRLWAVARFEALSACGETTESIAAASQTPVSWPTQPATHDFAAGNKKSRGWPGQAQHDTGGCHAIG